MFDEIQPCRQKKQQQQLHLKKKKKKTPPKSINKVHAFQTDDLPLGCESIFERALTKLSKLSRLNEIINFTLDLTVKFGIKYNEVK